MLMACVFEKGVSPPEFSHSASLVELLWVIITSVGVSMIRIGFWGASVLWL